MNISALSSLTGNLIEKALKEIRLGRDNSTPDKKKRFETALYFLSESRPYVDGAWEMIEADRVPAAFSLSRWVLEAALNLLWVVADEDAAEQRLTDLAGEALRQDAVLLVGLAALWPSLAGPLKDRADRARAMRKTIGAAKLECLHDRLQCIRGRNDPTSALDKPCSLLYVLYRVCCAAAHPGLRIWEQSADETSAGTASNRTENTILTPAYACHMAAMSPFNLVVYAYCLAEAGSRDGLKDWWSGKVMPLLNKV